MTGVQTCALPICSLEFVYECHKEDIQAIVGLEFEINFEAQKCSILCIAKNNQGYQALMDISSKLNCNERRVDLETLGQYAQSLFVIVYSDQGLFDQAFINDDEAEILRRMRLIQSIVPGVLLGINRQEEHYYQVQNKRLKELLKSIGIRSVAAHRVFYAEADHDEHHRVLKAIGLQKLLSDKQLTLERYRYLLSEAE